ncbi:unnamed protein product [Schistosoma intercalatum]|nr:unnamed protein product [Schistosoma intercalatum]CAH8614116.1 unnamed protein product [Schistosoma intercalatum]
MEVIVEYDYTAEENDELTIKKGDIIMDVSQFEEGWYIGCLNGRIGVFPDNFVKVKAPMQFKVSTIAVPEIESKETTDNDNNNMSNSDYENSNINTTTNSQSSSATKPKPVCGIGLGNIFSGQPIQLKQTALKEVVNKENESVLERDIGNSKILDDTSSNYLTNQVRARYEYMPKQADELELHVDDIIQVLDRNLPDDGWWRGRNMRTNLIGIFPDNFVSPINGTNKELDESKLQYSRNPSNVPNKSVSVKTITLQNGNDNATNRCPKNNNSTLPPNSNNPTAFDTNRITNNKPTSHNSSTRAVIVSSSSMINYPPNNFTNTVSTVGSLSSVVRSNSMGNSLNINQPTSVTTSSGLIQGESSSAINGKWRSTGKHNSYELSKVHNGDDGDTKSLDNTNVQRLVGYTSDRPRQTGRRLPTKLSNATNAAPDFTHTLNTPIRPSIAASKPNDAHVYDASMTRTNVACISANHESNVGSMSADQIDKSSESTYKQQGRTSSHATNPSRAASLQGNEISNGSAELNRSSENLLISSNQAVLNHRNKNQQNDIQHQFDQFQSEIKQQLHDIRREYDTLKEMHVQLRNDWLKGQKCLTERFQTLMNELDEIKKLRANDAIELSRFRKILMQLDASSLIDSSNHNNFGTTDIEDKSLTDTDVTESTTNVLNQKGVNFRKNPLNETEENHRDQNENIGLFDNKYQTNQLKSTSVKPSLRPRPIPTYGTVSNMSN